MARKALNIILIIGITLTNVGGCNLYSDLANKASDDAVMDDITNLIDHGLWNDAVLKLALVSPTAQQGADFKILAASAYAGRGGLDILNLITNMNNNAGGAIPKTLFEELMVAFQGATTSSYNDEISAQGYIMSIAAAPASRTSDQNIFMVFIELAKLGAMMASIADTNADGTLDPAFDNCDHALVPDSYAAEAVVAISQIILSLTAAGSSIAGSSITAIQAACNAAQFVDPNFCNTSDPSSVNAVQRAAARTLIGETNLGLGLKVASSAGVYQFTSPPVTAPVLCP